MECRAVEKRAVEKGWWKEGKEELFECSPQGPYRGQMRACYHRECDSKRRKFKGTFASYDFLAQVLTCYSGDMRPEFLTS